MSFLPVTAPISEESFLWLADGIQQALPSCSQFLVNEFEMRCNTMIATYNEFGERIIAHLEKEKEVQRLAELVIADKATIDDLRTLLHDD